MVAALVSASALAGGPCKGTACAPEVPTKLVPRVPKEAPPPHTQAVPPPVVTTLPPDVKICRRVKTMRTSYAGGMSVVSSGMLIPGCEGWGTWLPGVSVSIPPTVTEIVSFVVVCE